MPLLSRLDTESEAHAVYLHDFILLWFWFTNLLEIERRWLREDGIIVISDRLMPYPSQYQFALELMPQDRIFTILGIARAGLSSCQLVATKTSMSLRSPCQPLMNR